MIITKDNIIRKVQTKLTKLKFWLVFLLINNPKKLDELLLKFLLANFKQN